MGSFNIDGGTLERKRTAGCINAISDRNIDRQQLLNIPLELRKTQTLSPWQEAG